MTLVFLPLPAHQMTSWLYLTCEGKKKKWHNNNVLSMIFPYCLEADDSLEPSADIKCFKEDAFSFAKSSKANIFKYPVLRKNYTSGGATSLLCHFLTNHGPAEDINVHIMHRTYTHKHSGSYENNKNQATQQHSVMID